MTCQFYQMKRAQLVRINHFILYILILISRQYRTLAAEIQQQMSILGNPLMCYNLLRSILFNRPSCN